MPRPRLVAGQLGKIRFSFAADGHVRGRARVGTVTGKTVYLRAQGWTEKQVASQLRRFARRHLTDFAPPFSATTTFSKVLEYFGGETGLRVREQSRLSTEDLEALGSFVLPEFADIPLADVSAERVDYLVAQLMVAHGRSVALKAREALARLLGESVASGALARNPIRRADRLPTQKKLGRVLSPEQFEIVRALLNKWKSPSGRTADVPEIVDGIDIIRETCADIATVLALRPDDIDLESPVATIKLECDLRRNVSSGDRASTLEPTRIVLTHRALSAVKARLSHMAEPGKGHLFSLADNRIYPPARFERLLRAFAEDHRDVLATIHIDAKRFDSRIFRPSHSIPQIYPASTTSPEGSRKRSSNLVETEEDHLCGESTKQAVSFRDLHVNDDVIR